MTFYTSYYAKINELREKYPDYKLISISGDIPDYIKNSVDGWDRRLAPNWSLFKEYKNSDNIEEREKTYIKRFKEEVLNKDINEVFNEWTKKFGLNSKFVLLCYEANDPSESTFCHRRIVAEAIENKYGIEVKELDFNYDDYKIEDYKVKLKYSIDTEEW